MGDNPVKYHGHPSTGYKYILPCKQDPLLLNIAPNRVGWTPLPCLRIWARDIYIAWGSNVQVPCLHLLGKTLFPKVSQECTDNQIPWLLLRNVQVLCLFGSVQVSWFVYPYVMSVIVNCTKNCTTALPLYHHHQGLLRHWSAIFSKLGDQSYKDLGFWKCICSNWNYRHPNG